jgi:UDPglucose--hexose-1-phosphate uridylyltransferase
VSTLRHPLTGDPVLHAPQRAARPHAFAGQPRIERCPFCPGHESDTPPELARIGEPWRVRVVPNKYPPAEGAEVIVESPRHDASFENIADLGEVLGVYGDRLRAHAGAAHVALFRNDGPRAGASMAHVHAQLVPLPFVPPRIARELAAFARSCPLCAPEGVVIGENRSFVHLAPAVSAMPYEQWIVPRRHVASMTALDADERHDLGALLRFALAATRRIGDFNATFMTFAPSSPAHFHVEILPRITTLAGLELATGTFVEIIEPTAAAARLRG